MYSAKNMTAIKTSSDGAWQGDNPLNYAFPLLIIQTTLVLFVSRFVAFLLKPFRQPRVVAEIVGGVLLGPSALGRNKEFLHLVFPSWSTPTLESVASIGLLFFLFLVGLELDLSSFRQYGRRAFSIALAGISLPFIFGVAVSFFLRKAVHGEDKVGYGQYILFMGVALSITAFPVLARILAELKLLTTQVGQTAMAAAAFNDVAAWILLALAVSLAGTGASGGSKSPLISIWVLVSGVAFVALMFVFVRPMMGWVAKQCSPQHDFLDEGYICLTLAGVMLSGFMTDLIGIHAVFGAFVYGLIIPKGGEFASRLIKRIEDFVSGLLLPLYFASSGLKTDVAKISGAEAWGLLLLVISTACAGKILGTFAMAMLYTIPVRESLALGALMNTKGLMELIVLNIGKEKKVLNDEMFAILVLMALFTTFMTTPAVMAIYKPARRTTSRASGGRQSPMDEKTQKKLRILACIHGLGNVPALINLIESARCGSESPIKLYVMHLVELTDRSSSIMMVQRARKNGFPFINRFSHVTFNNQIEAAFKAYCNISRLNIRHSTAISALSTMHEDICHVAEDKRVEMIILPFHKRWAGMECKEEIDNVGERWREVNMMVLDAAPCTVAVLVDRGFGASDQEAGTAATVHKRVCILFFGGHDDREALNVGVRMAAHPAIGLTVLRFRARTGIEGRDSTDYYKGRDEAALEEFRRKCNRTVEYEEKEITNVSGEVLAIGQSTSFDMLIVGKDTTVPGTLAEHQELGLLGDTLASPDHGIVPSVLVVQHHGKAHDENASPTIAQVEDVMII